MANYGSTYNINQEGDLFTLQDHGSAPGLGKYASAKGTSVNSPLNYRFLKLFRGFDSQFFFFVKNQDRKPIMLQGVTVNASFIDRTDRSTVVSKKAIITDYEQGSIKVILTVGESALFSQGLYDLVFSYTNDVGLVLPLYCDTNMRPNFTVECSEEGDALPLTTQINDTFTTQVINSVTYYYSSALKATGYFNKPNGLVTLAVYGTNYTGNFYVEGALSENPTEGDWFNITLGSYTDPYYPYTGHTGIDPWTFRTNVNYIRTKHTQPTGTLDKIIVRV
jgi:hypothetical protein|tara:strand:+ start:1133 stop:1966 length:834 start_codon:yes stop_codon:yes gene_type:complete